MKASQIIPEPIEEEEQQLSNQVMIRQISSESNNKDFQKQVQIEVVQSPELSKTKSL